MRKYFYLLLGLVMILLFKEVGAIFALFMVFAFIAETLFSKTYNPWVRKNNQEDYNENKKLNIKELNSLKK